MRAYEWKTALILTLATMILMRLVWMDLRSYVVIFSPQNHYALEHSEPCARSLEQSLTLKLGEQLLPRPGWAHAWSYHSIMQLSCRNGIFSVGSFVRYNQGLLIMTVLILVLLTRVLARSWIIGLIMAVALLSRGRLIAALGQVGGDQLIGFGLAVWGLTLAHWLRSGSRAVLVLHYLCIAWLVPLEPGLLFLLGVLPCLLARPVRRWVFGPSAPHTAHSPLAARLGSYWPWRELAGKPSLAPGTEPTPGALLRPWEHGTDIGPLLAHGRYRRKIWAFALWGSVICAAEFLLLMLLRSDPLLRRGFDWTPGEFLLWLESWAAPIDRDLGLGLLCMFVSLALWRRSWVLALRPLISVSLAAVLLSSLGSFVGDLLFLPGGASRLWMGPHLLLWWEPLLLALSLLAFYNIVLELIPRALQYASKWLSSPQKVG